jgi:hypothetical protein
MGNDQCQLLANIICLLKPGMAHLSAPEIREEIKNQDEAKKAKEKKEKEA